MGERIVVDANHRSIAGYQEVNARIGLVPPLISSQTRQESPMETRFIRLAAGAALAVLAAAGSAQVADRQKVVYHVTEAERVPFVLGNIENHIRGVGGPDKVEIILVAHGPAVKAFEKKEAPPPVLERIAGLKRNGVDFNACGNTLRNNKAEIGDLADGFVRVDQGGVVRIVELQQQGYVYLRP
jgi:hypothetical protein